MNNPNPSFTGGRMTDYTLSHGSHRTADDGRCAMESRGLTTQQSLADRWGVSRGNLSKILNRKVYVDA
jgi:hypothetical protein